MNKISNVYKNDNVHFNNNQKYCVVDLKNKNFKDYILSNHELLQRKVKIVTNEKEYETYIYRIEEKGIITFQNDFILFSNIKSIDIIS